MIILGITGGVGSGKSKILYELESEYNAFVIEADKLAHKLMEPGEVIYNKIVECFGRDILEDNEPYSINRAKLGEIVFENEDKLKMLNSISHPLVKEKIIELIKHHKSFDTKLFVIEAALLIEDGYTEICDEIWYIWVDQEERIKRLMNSRGYTRKKCFSIINNQKDDSYYKNYTNRTIDNSKSFDYTAKQLKDLLNNLSNNDIIN